ncbi:uncharacterized protein LOC133192948 [Saccostrea echinata]|uniref:uncharacterized protein LOC133192948 n=1 Tax=Saccostrea echinata TaxID=191078 RepID=UPI002A7F0C02|nr:uncharacterized protein LOC133192948 [Saccostrea echinata]
MSTDSKFVTVGNLKVRVIKGDIKDQKVDVIVNSSRPDLDLSKGRASNALLSAAGEEIQTEIQQNYTHGIQDGEIAITSGGQLSCEAIYHGALSKYSSTQDEKILEKLIQTCLDQANTDGYETMAIPALGTGFLSFPVPAVARIMFDCIQNFTPQSLSEVRIVIFPTEKDIFKVFLTEAKKFLHKGQGNQTKAKSHSHKIGKMTVEVVVDTLSSIHADVLVCSGPKDLQLSNGGLSQSLLEVAGEEMQEELDSSFPNGIDFGECAVSEGYNLNCKYVYHGALPKWGTNTPDPSYILKKFMSECLEEANKHSTKSIAFPTLGLGALHFPVDQTAKLMVQCLRDFNMKHRQISITIDKVIIVVYNKDKDWSLLQSKMLKELKGQMFAATVSKTVYTGKIDRISVNVKVGNLTEEKVDVLVNSVTPDLGMTAGTAAALATAAGVGMTNELTQNYPKGIQHGDIAVTTGHEMTSVKEIYHGALLPWYSKRSGSTKPPAEILEEFVLNCLKKANSSGHKSISFPALGTGYHKFPADIAASSMVLAFEKFCKTTPNKTISEIQVVLFGGSSDLQYLEKAFQSELSHMTNELSKDSGANGGKAHKTHHRHIQRRGPKVIPQRGTKNYLIWKYQEEGCTPSYWTKFTNKKKLKEWNLAVKSGASHLENVDQNTFQSIEKAFKSTLSNAQIVSIQRIENVELFLKYSDECQRLFRKAIAEGEFVPLDKVSGSRGPVKTMGHLDTAMTKHTHHEINEYYFFHGTKPDYVAVITGQGLDNRLAYTGGLLGTGVYGAEDSAKSDGYTGADINGCRPMFLMRMCLGDIYMTTQKGGFKRPPCKKCGRMVCTSHQEIYDSVVASFSYREFVVYDRCQSYPEYLIWYKIMATDGGNRFVTVGNLRVRVIKGNLSDQQVDVIVNSNGSDLDLSKGRASKALLSAAGFGIQVECQQNYPNGIQDGEIAITSGGQLSCQAIYHGALSKYSSTQDEQTLQNLIDASLKQAESDGHQTIAFPALGAGRLGYPATSVAEILLTCINNITPQSLQEVLIVIFKKDNDLFKADVLVCSGPKDLQLSNGGLSEALLRVAGREMQDELNQNYSNGVEYGDIAVSGGHRLQCKFVYHGALPKWGTSQPDPSSTLEKFMEKCLETANNHSTRSIAFPTLGVGSLHYPSDQTAKLMVKTIRDFSTKHSRMNIRKIIIVVYSGSNDWSTVQNEFMKELKGGSSGATFVPGTSGLCNMTTSTVSRQSYSGQVGGIPVIVLVGSLVEQKVNLIIVANDLGMTSGTSGAIGTAAGPGLSQELAQNYPQGINHGDIALLEDFVLGCLEKANKSGYTSIALPALGTGFHKFPADVAAANIVSSIEKFSKQRQQQSISDIRVVLYGGSSDLPKLEMAFKDEINQANSSGKSSPVPSAPNRPRNVQSIPQRGTKAYLDYKYREALRTPPYWTKYTSDKKLKGWNLQVKSGKFHLENIDQVTHRSIGNALKRTLGNAQIVSIQRLENVELFLKYGEECQRLFRKASVEGNFTTLDKIPQSRGPVKVMGSLDPSMTKHTHSEINEYYFFHATKSQYVDVICSQGLDSRLAASGRLGAGVYGAEVASKSHQYAGCDNQNRYPMFLVRMSLGDIYLTNSGGNYKRPPCKICTNPVCVTHQEIHDSVVANGGAFSDREFVVYDRNQSYPEYLIWYNC